jgi:hypothetical protein
MTGNDPVNLGLPTRVRNRGTAGPADAVPPFGTFLIPIDLPDIAARIEYLDLVARPEGFEPPTL